jgi:hypothetical protein
MNKYNDNTNAYIDHIDDKIIVDDNLNFELNE